MKVVVLFFCVVSLAYFSLGSGYIDATDAEPSLDTAKALWQKGELQVSEGIEGTYFRFLELKGEKNRYLYHRSADGFWYSKLGLAMPLLYLPAVALGNLYSPKELWIRFFASQVNAVLMALTVTLLFLCLYRSTDNLSFAAAMALIAGFATHLAPYSKMSHREAFQALAVLLAYSGFYLQRKPEWLLATGTGLLLLCKPWTLITLLPAYVLLWAKRPRAVFTVLALISPLFLIFYFHPLSFTQGYSPAVVQLHPVIWKTSWWEGMFLQYLSPREGLFLFQPVLFLSLLLYRHSPLHLALLCAIFLQGAIHARWFSPTGREALGARYLVAILPLFFLWLRPFSWKRLAAAPLVALSLSFQVAAVSVKPQLYWHLGSTEIQPAFFSRVFLKKIQGLEEGDFREHATLQGLNFWWSHWRRQTNEVPHEAHPNSREVARVDHGMK